MSKTTSTSIGFIAILLWSLLALFTAAIGIACALITAGAILAAKEMIFPK